MIISHTTKKYIEEQIIFYQANVNEYKQIRDAILFESRAVDENVGGGKSNIPSNVIESRVIRLDNQRIRLLEQRIRCVENVYERLDDERKKFWHLCFWQRRYTMNGLAHKMHMSRASAFRWKNKMIIDVAKELGY